MVLSKENLFEMFWFMLLARRLDEQAWKLLKQGKIKFHVSCIGHEALQVGAGYAIRRGYDWVAPYYRDLALMLTLGLTPEAFMLSLRGKKGDPGSDGRQTPASWSLKQANVISHSTSLAAQTTQAAGVALGIKMRGEDKVVLSCTGEGATSMGEWYEGVNFAAVHRLPVVFLVENNRYAISMSPESQMAVEDLTQKAVGLGLTATTVNGRDMAAVYDAVSEAVYRARDEGGPSIVEATTYRITPHSSDDDDRGFRSRKEVEAYRRKDPLLLTKASLVEAGVLTEQQVGTLEEKAQKIIYEAVEQSDAAPYPAPGEAAGPVYARGDDLCLK
jgi:2-oxoisovalerate dehydrogenase E1 component alpha subunit